MRVLKFAVTVSIASLFAAVCAAGQVIPQQTGEAVAAPSTTDPVTVQDLQQTIVANQWKSDKELAEELAGMQLTERLSTPRLERLKVYLPGEKSQQALLAMADASAFRELPANDELADPAPDAQTAGQIISSATDFVLATVSKMPDFLASRTTTRFQDLRVSHLSNVPTIVTGGSFQLVDKVNVSVSYQNGHELEDKDAANKSGEAGSSSQGLTTCGIFGPLLGVVMADILQGKIGWSHWERSASGPVAVFHYAVAKDKASYTVRYCCFPDKKRKMQLYETVPAYHGEIAIDARTGSILRLVVKTDLEPFQPIFRADVVVEYGPVEIGGKRYICPRKSVSISTATATVLNGTVYREDHVIQQLDNGPKVTAINDVSFVSYHVFAGEMRIVPAENTLPPADAKPSGTTVPSAPSPQR
jgi:hypothetical protein